MAFDTFMYFEKASAGGVKIEGETQDDKYASKKAFEVYSFSWGASNPVTIGSRASGTGGGKVSLSSFNVMKKSDAASPALFRVCASGDHFDSAKVTLRKAGGTQVEYLKYEFHEVFVESIQWSGSSGGDDTPTESVSFAFGAVHIDYYQQKKDGTLDTGAKSAEWSQVTNTPSIAVGT